MKTLARRMVLAAAGLAACTLAACSYQGNDIGNPLRRKAQWYSFVEGEDLKATCDQGAPDRYRLVYNGIYGQQLRAYDLDPVRKLLVVRVSDQGDGSSMIVDNLFGPWSATEERVQLDAKTYDGVIAAFAQSGMFDPPPVGLDLPARSYFWTAAFCRNGSYGFTAWKYPSPAFSSITFDKVLLPLDPTNVQLAAPGPVPYDVVWENERKYNRVVDFTMKVGRSGLVH